MMTYKQDIAGRTFAANTEHEGVFELCGGAYKQHRGTGQTPSFKTPEQFRRYVQRMLRHDLR